MTGTASPNSQPTPTLGWREWVSLPVLGVDWIKAKIDTGARSSSIHAEAIEPFTRNGKAWVRYTIRPWQASDADPIICESPIIEQRHVRSSSGESAERYVVSAVISLGGVSNQIELTLARRDQMGFRMLIGRQAIRGTHLVDSSRSYLGGRPPKTIRARNKAISE